MSDLIDDIFGLARAKGVSQARLAAKAGLRPETLSRLKHRDNFDARTLHRLARAVGRRLAVVPLDSDDGHAVYSPRAIAREKAESRRLDEDAVASGRASRQEIQRRSGFFSLPRAKFPIKGLSPKPR
jgi:transcriptional regulator with XRE-family HTH domain